MDTTLVELFRHNQWANLRLLDACSNLTVLTHLGIEPPVLSGWAFGDEMGY